VVVPKAVGTAVVRNRLKRRVRAVWSAAAPGAGAIDCVVVCRPEAAALSFGELAAGIERALLEAGRPGRRAGKAGGRGE
jgi:ribonuclease P protein component